MRPYNADSERVSLEGLYAANGGRPVHWADMGGGRGLAMRQLATMPRFAGKLAMTNVDLFDYGLDGLDDDDLDYIEELSPGIADDATRPALLQADVETAVLPEPADLITSVESIQYLNNPIASISSWYNQLRDNGFLMIATEGAWVSWMRYQKHPYGHTQKEPLIQHVFEELGRAAVSFAATYELDYEAGERPVLMPNYTSYFVAQKKPGTHMVVNSRVTEIWKNPQNYKAVYYEEPKPEAKPVVEIVQDELAMPSRTPRP